MTELYASLYWEPDEEADDSQNIAAYRAIDGPMSESLVQLGDFESFDFRFEPEMFGGLYLRVYTEPPYDPYGPTDPGVIRRYERERRKVDDWLSSVPWRYGFTGWSDEPDYSAMRTVSSWGRKTRPASRGRLFARRRR